MIAVWIILSVTCLLSIANIIMFCKVVPNFITVWRGMTSSPQPQPKKPRCTGYLIGATSTYDNCRAFRSEHCADGRCSVHCRYHCKCEGLNVPEMKKYLKT